ncbi:putative receptor-like protein kinase [Dorcoceras hygrometricum]|uniref:Putative receptor-like protein kinase n=1 Tax=Dorcoceras hygrometricum TaxID=472368 RepID=A0A2Z7A074_9LAMI|nr:putative receptor-like protein kinase [Dorcoceras hygrometricum]
MTFCRPPTVLTTTTSTTDVVAKNWFGYKYPSSPLLPPRKVPLEEFDPQTQSPSLAPGELLDFTPALDYVTHLFYAYVRKATDTEFNVFVLGRDLIFGL